jgi:hypothetical protein
VSWTELVTTIAQATPETANEGGKGRDILETLSWAIALPGALAVAIAAPWAVRKSRLDARKTELEILEKERALGVAGEAKDSHEVVRIVAEPVLQTVRAQTILLRFVFLYLMLQVMELLGGVLNLPLNSATLALQSAVQSDASLWHILGNLGVAILASIPGIVRALVLVGIGWPLLLDAARLLSIEIPPFLQSARTRQVLTVIAVLAATANALLGFVLSIWGASLLS